MRDLDTGGMDTRGGDRTKGAWTRLGRWVDTGVGDSTAGSWTWGDMDTGTHGVLDIGDMKGT